MPSSYLKLTSKAVAWLTSVGVSRTADANGLTVRLPHAVLDLRRE